MRIRSGPWLAALAVLIANGAALRHAAANRSGVGPEVLLTERELPQEAREKDDTGVSLRLNWGNSIALKLDRWLNRAKLRELGFDVSADPANDAARARYYSMPSRPAFVALEYDGPAWQESLSEYEDQLRNSPGGAPLIEQARNGGSRLVPVDAATNAVTLRARYPDASRVLIVNATVRIGYADAASKTLSGYLQPVMTHVHVALPLSRQFDAIPEPVYSGSRIPPRYQVHLRFGFYREPWVVNVTPLR